MSSAFLKSSVFIDRFHRIRVDGSRIPKEEVAFSNENGYVWIGPWGLFIWRSGGPQVGEVTCFK